MWKIGMGLKRRAWGKIPATWHGWILIGLLGSAQCVTAQTTADISSDSAQYGIPVQREFSRFGIALKMGESAGLMGIQAAWNFSNHVQACAGAGGVADGITELDFFSDAVSERTDSYFLLAKFYWEHLFLATGYNLKVSKVEKVSGTRVTVTNTPEHGIPFHLGYEFGHRSGFYYSTSVGYLYIPGGGGKVLAREALTDKPIYRSAASGPSFGMSIGYYLW